MYYYIASWLVPAARRVVCSKPEPSAGAQVVIFADLLVDPASSSPRSLRCAAFSQTIKTTGWVVRSSCQLLV